MYSRIDNYLREMGFQRIEADPNLYFLVGEFEMKDLGLMHYFLGL
jgi:hypothetical protein